MSFYRVGHSRRKRAPVQRKPIWDDTVQDLTVYRASPEEIMLRKESHKSKNHLSVRLEKMRKDVHKNKLTGAETQQLAIMKEILYDQNQLQDILAKSDTMMTVVKDLFGDDPKRFMGFPNVTTAPHYDGDHSSLAASGPDIYTQIEKLSDSMMDQSALNDDLDAFYSEDEIDCPDPISYESKLNLQHFKDYLQEEKSKTDNAAPKPLVSKLSKTNSNTNVTSNISNNNAEMNSQRKANRMDTTQALPLLNTLLDQGDKGQSKFGNPLAIASLLALLTANSNPNFQTPTKRTPPLASERTPPSAMNDTKKIRRSKKVRKSPKVSSESVNTTTSMNDMKKVLQELESEISSYEHPTGRCPQEETHKAETFSGYTVALVTAVSRLAKYLRETDLRVRAEVTLREQLTQDVYQLQTIIDALATDLIVTQEEYGKLHSEYKCYRESTDVEMRSFNNQLRELRHLVTGKEPMPASWSESENQQQKTFSDQHQKYYEIADSRNITKQSEKTSKTSTPLFNQHVTSPQSGSESGTYQPLPSRLGHSESAAAAVMLSPPVRKTRVQTSNSNVDAGVQLPNCQRALADLCHLTHEGVTYSADPPRLTQTPPVVNTVSVPRPIPLVQSNLSIPLTSGLSVSHTQEFAIYNGQGRKREGTTGYPVQTAADLVKFGNETKQQLQQLQEIAIEEALNNPDMQLLMQAQIVELNRQQEEARLKLLDLLDNQRQRQKLLQDQIGLDNSLDSFIGEGSDWQNNMQKSVSPPISPISQRSEEVIGMKEALHLAGQGRGMTVSLPMTSNLNDSDGSITSPRPEVVQPGK